MTNDTSNARAVARDEKKRADAAFYKSELTRQRERFAKALGQSVDEARREAACWIAAAATVFERDAERMPSRAKRAVELLKHAVFMLDPKAPA
ncbi:MULTISPECIES: hypothetical protein [Burkholderia]|uniref:Uncharacterized protein n=1 Tax=Burkholderia ubonensis TaxID=101571 RepID=A0A1B4LDM9_9BURK|nr:MULTISPECIES: hypothetical protein [Burkholderia]EMD9439657.1 hypothetical protein [Burkholderia cepacia]AOJ75286.1 hypothetical protein WJ35_09520 [Burkholderia ubonensis]AOK09082.1 hypothetical protein WK31_01910 [Burkholderia vietnamiensis]MBR8392794.1 hypothetical protein [Burkholderia cenocepacia]MBR8470217.1 hypothetical protein [Burkholderia cenocepacia]